MSEFETSLHTIIVLIGPSNCGKSHFAKHTLIPNLTKILQDKDIIPNIQYISSDEIRRMLQSNPNLNKYDSVMLESSHQAFNLLYTYLDNVTQFPINAHFCILDTTGLNKEFREKVINIAKKNNYRIEAIVFNYNMMSDYFKNGGDKKVIEKHVKKLKSSVLREIGKEFDSKHIIKSQGQEFNIKISDLVLYKSCLLNPEKRYIVCGDLHEALDEFKQLITNVGFLIDENDIIRHTDKTKDLEIVSVGDLPDKGSSIRETVDFFHKNLHNPEVTIRIVSGNHDFAIRKLILGQSKEESHPEGFVSTFYSSYNTFKYDPELSKKFLEIEATMVPFLGYISKDNSKSFYVIHAACHERYVGKVNKDAIKNQRYVFSGRDKDSIEEHNPWPIVKKVINPDSYNYPYIVSGHFAFKTIYNGAKKHNNRILIDTGAIYGNSLSAVLLGKNIEIPKFYSINFMNKQPPFPSSLPEIEPEVQLVAQPIIDINEIYKNLNKEQVARINHLLQNRVNYISTTVSPAPCDHKNNELESLKEGLKYYYDQFTSRNITKIRLSIQPKYMGSRANVYLFLNDIDRSYMVSRNGYLMKQLDPNIKKKLLSDLNDKFKTYMTDNKIKLLIIDSELMPWSAIGSGLIDKTFKTIDTAIDNELTILKKHGFEERYAELQNKMKDTGIDKELSVKSKKELAEKYDSSTLNTFRLLMEENRQHIHIDTLKEKHALYHQQLEIYAKETKVEEITIKPFSILKIVYDDDTELIPGILIDKIGQIEAFQIVSEDKQLVIDFDEGFDQCLQKAKEYYDALTNIELMEGVVIKPDFYLPKLAPYIKVRNPNYLTIIYGYDYTTENKYKKLMKQKNITKKIRMSIEEFDVGIQMLKTKYTDISENNVAYAKLLSNFLFLEEGEKDIDPRL